MVVYILQLDKNKRMSEEEIDHIIKNFSPIKMTIEHVIYSFKFLRNIYIYSLQALGLIISKGLLNNEKDDEAEGEIDE